MEGLSTRARNRGDNGIWKRLKSGMKTGNRGVRMCILTRQRTDGDKIWIDDEDGN